MNKTSKSRMEAIFKAYVSSKSLSKDKNISKSATL